MFEIEAEDAEGSVDITCERMWVIVADKVDDTCIGILDNQPASIEHGDDICLCFGAEIPFNAEHVIEVDTPPVKYSE